MGPLSKILIEVFAKSFYKTHVGLLLFLFVTVFSYGFFIQVLNIDATHEEVTKYNFIIILEFISSPIIAIGVFSIWLFWTFKTWKYISELLIEPQNQFLFYSALSLSKSKQFGGWLYTQIFLSLPIIIYALCSLVAGLFIGDYFIPIYFLFYILVVCLISAGIYVKWSNKPLKADRNALSIVTAKWGKPFHTLFIYHLFSRLKIPLIITKLVSYCVIAGGYFIVNHQDEFQFGSLLVLGVVVSHSLLIYQSYQFEYHYLSFARNFPSQKFRIYFSWVFTYLVLTLPENLWLIVSFPPEVCLFLFLFSVGTCMIFRSILYTSTLEMKRYIYVVLLIFVVFYLVILFGYIVPLSVFSFLLSFLIFQMDYLKQKTFYKSQSDFGVKEKTKRV